MKIRGNTIGTPIKPEKNLVKATGLSSEEQAQARLNIGTAGVFVAEYGVTPNADMEEAYKAGKALFCRDGIYLTPLYHRTSGGSFVFMSNDSESQTNRYCGITSGWNKKTTKLCATKFNDIDETIGDIETALDSIIEIQNSLIGGE